MRNEKLKNDLNNIPQDFDREAMWNNIELPQRRRKNRLVLWFLFFGISLSGFLLFILQNEDVSADKNLVEIETIADNVSSTTDKKLSTPDQVESTTENFEKSTFNHISNQNIPAQVEKSSQTKEQKDLIVQNEEALDIQSNELQKFDNSETSVAKKEPMVQNGLDDSEKISIIEPVYSEQPSIQPSIILNEQKAKSTAQNIRSNELEYSFQAEMGEENVQSTKNVSPSRNLLLVSEITSISIKELTIENEKITDVGMTMSSQIEEVQNLDRSNFLISATSFIGSTKHNFNHEGGMDLRAHNESALESVGLSLFGHINIGKTDFFSGITYLRYNTHVENNSSKFLVVNSAQGLAEKSINTQYSLYNAYQFLDFITGFGYNIQLGNKWSLRPSVQVGYTFKYMHDGEIFDSANEIVKLSEIEGYADYSKWQGQLNLSVTREINDQWGIGIMTYINSQKSLGIFEGYTHSVASFGMGLTLNRNFD